MIKTTIGRLRRLWLRKEQRASSRYKVDWPIRYRRAEAGSGKRAEFRDLSEGGAGVVVQESFHAGNSIHLEFMLPGQPSTLTVSGRVMWVKEMYPLIKPFDRVRFYYVGVQFQAMDAPTRTRLQAALKRDKR